MKVLVILLFLLLALIQELWLGWSLVVVGLVGVALVFEPAEALFLGFVAGLWVDMVRDGLWGVSLLFNLVVVMVVWSLSKVLPKRQGVLLSFLVMVISATERWLFAHRFSLGQVMGSLVVFWGLMLVLGRVSEIKRDVRDLRI